MTINQMVSSLSFTIFFGFFLTALMIISMLYFAFGIHTYLGLVKNGNLIEIALSGSLIVICALGFYFLFRAHRKKTVKTSADPLISFSSIDFKLLAFNFTEGFIDGLVKNKDSNDDDILNKSGTMQKRLAPNNLIKTRV